MSDDNALFVSHAVFFGLVAEFVKIVLFLSCKLSISFPSSASLSLYDLKKLRLLKRALSFSFFILCRFL